MANMYFNSNFEECSINDSPMYIYVDDVIGFHEECGNDETDDGIDRPGVYQWNDFFKGWSLPYYDITQKVNAIVKQNSLWVVQWGDFDVRDIFESLSDAYNFVVDKIIALYPNDKENILKEIKKNYRTYGFWAPSCVHCYQAIVHKKRK